MAPTPRYKERADLTVEEELAYRRTGQLPEREEYKQARADALALAGLDPEEPAPAARTGDLARAQEGILTTAQYLSRRRST